MSGIIKEVASGLLSGCVTALTSTATGEKVVPPKKPNLDTSITDDSTARKVKACIHASLRTCLLAGQATDLQLDKSVQCFISQRAKEKAEKVERAEILERAEQYIAEDHRLLHRLAPSEEEELSDAGKFVKSYENLVIGFKDDWERSGNAEKGENVNFITSKIYEIFGKAGVNIESFFIALVRLVGVGLGLIIYLFCKLDCFVSKHAGKLFDRIFVRTFAKVEAAKQLEIEKQERAKVEKQKQQEVAKAKERKKLELLKAKKTQAIIEAHQQPELLASAAQEKAALMVATAKETGNYIANLEREYSNTMQELKGLISKAGLNPEESAVIERALKIAYCTEIAKEFARNPSINTYTALLALKLEKNLEANTNLLVLHRARLHEESIKAKAQAIVLQEFPPLEIESIKEKEKILREDIDDLRDDILELQDNEKEKQKELSDQIALKKKELFELGKKKKELQKLLEKLETDVICLDKVLPMMVFAILIDQLVN